MNSWQLMQRYPDGRQPYQCLLTYVRTQLSSGRMVSDSGNNPEHDRVQWYVQDHCQERFYAHGNRFTAFSALRAYALSDRNVWLSGIIIGLALPPPVMTIVSL